MPLAFKILVLDAQCGLASDGLVQVGNAQAALFKGPLVPGFLEDVRVDKHLFE